jgi:hypothetical protein
VITGEALASATPAQATQGSAVLLGQDNTGATARTGLFTTGTESAVLANPVSHIGVQGTGSGSGSGVLGEGGSDGDGVTGFGGVGGGRGVVGNGAGIGAGVVGNADISSTAAHGVEGFGVGAGSGVVGNGGTNGGTGVIGSARGTDGTGVVGFGTGSGAGVTGFGGSGAGDGVIGGSAKGRGVHGRATAAQGIGVLAENTGGGTALQASGRTVFSRSGILTVAAGQSKVTKTGVALTAGSLVLATLQQDVAGVWVRSAVPSVAGHSFTVHLSKAVPAKTKIAWFVVN